MEATTMLRNQLLWIVSSFQSPTVASVLLLDSPYGQSLDTSNLSTNLIQNKWLVSDSPSSHTQQLSTPWQDLISGPSFSDSPSSCLVSTPHSLPLKPHLLLSVTLPGAEKPQECSSHLSSVSLDSLVQSHSAPTGVSFSSMLSITTSVPTCSSSSVSSKLSAVDGSLRLTRTWPSQMD